MDSRRNEASGSFLALFETRGLRPLEHPRVSAANMADRTCNSRAGLRPLEHARVEGSGDGLSIPAAHRLTGLALLILLLDRLALVVGALAAREADLELDAAVLEVGP